ncbi:hypothetical protein V6N11_065267 [Hibiscus sabdariffa]|uniref:Uncharacterized protein n=1 Tax=Hibiscus sabdariffa TaxID=183260 RepID=A0ABR2QGF0_9ROSI
MRSRYWIVRWRIGWRGTVHAGTKCSKPGGEVAEWLLDVGHSLKKGRSDGVDVCQSHAIDMEVDGIVHSTVKGILDVVDQLVGDIAHVTMTKDSYESKVTTLKGSIQGNSGVTSVMEQKVIILEEDEIMDRFSAIPSIRFSDRLHDQVGANM